MKKRGARTAKQIESLRIDFLSPVDRPAQEGAIATLLKRDATERTGDTPRVIVTKNTPGVMTGATDGHTHIVWLHGRLGETTLQMSADATSMHDHPWVLNPDGTILVGENFGHTHTVSSDSVTAALIEMQKRDDTPGDGPVKKESTMPDPKTKTEKSAEDLEAEIASLTETAELRGIVAGMDDEEREHLETLDDTAKVAFVGKGHDARTEEITAVHKAAEAKNPVVYTTKKGMEIHESDGAAVLMLARDADEQRERAEKAEATTASASVRKRAETELAHMPGTLDERTAMLKAIDSMPDKDEREAALKALKASDHAMSKRFENGGTSEGPQADEDAPMGKLDALAKRHAEKEGVTEAQAYDAVLKTDEGKSLYSELDQQ